MRWLLESEFSNLVDKTDSAIFAIQNVVRIYAKSHRPEENQDGGVRASRIVAAWAEQKVVREIMVFLHSHGVGTARADGTVIADPVGQTPCVFLTGLHRAERTIAERFRQRHAALALDWSAESTSMGRGTYWACPC
jgi:hypothetical protein